MDLSIELLGGIFTKHDSRDVDGMLIFRGERILGIGG